MQTSKKKVVVIGGGTGTYTILRGLKAYTDIISITAIVTMADSGGSTGRLRDEFGQLPVGDVRKALCALATDSDAHTDVLRELFLYRFDKGAGLQGHNFGNLLLTALTDILGDTSLAIETASQILRVNGSVIPVTTDNVQLVATYNTGRQVIGEHHIDVPNSSTHFDHIIHLQVSPAATINQKAKLALEAADLIVLGPGDLYTSILATGVVGGVGQAMQNSSAKIVYVCNLMSRSGQTIGMHSAEYIAEIKKYLGVSPQCVLMSDAALPPQLLAVYEAEGNHLVENNYSDTGCTVHHVDIVSTESYLSKSGDTLTRSLIRHDSKKLAKAVVALLPVY